MKPHHILTTLFVLTAAAFLFSSEPGKKPATTSNGKKVLLAYGKTRFKNALIERIQELLTQDSVDVTVIKHSRRNMKNYSAADYDAVFITNSGVRSKVRPWIVKWLQDNKSHGDNILLHTTQTKDWQVTVEVEAVTSASSMPDVEKLAEEYFAGIKSRYTETDSSDVR